MPSLRYFYSDKIGDFLTKSEDAILGELSRNNDYDLASTQRDAWLGEIQILKDTLKQYSHRGSVFFEYKIPRVGRRIDVALLIDGIVFVLEFKVGEKKFLQADTDQVEDYALNLKNFHEGSHDRTIIPILVATEADEKKRPNYGFLSSPDKILKPLFSNRDTLEGTIRDCLEYLKGACDVEFDAESWARSRYLPTPTIIDAARALYLSHSVSEISRSDASAQNLTETCECVFEVIRTCKEEKKKAICFVTGVPGAGKTLVGLNIATQQRQNVEQTEDNGALAVYLSGNDPLVSVLVEALARDSAKREKENGVSKKGARGDVIKRFIQLIHRYRDDCLEGTKIVDGEVVADLEYFKSEENKNKSYAPVEHVAIFDEAQRAWTKEKLAAFMKTKKGRPNFPYSEPEYLISCLDRHEDWAVVVCLVGGGQEIGDGEAGIAEWVRALNDKFPEWSVYVSPNLTEKEYAEGEVSTLLSARQNVHYKPSLHLSVSMRSFRAEKLSLFIHHLLEINSGTAREIYAGLREKYPIYLTRSVEKAKKWLKEKTRGLERCGILASSKAKRLKPLSVDVRARIDVIHWFLGGRGDVRSSNFLEEVATEFEVQGLEIDWACVVWDGDFRYTPSGWQCYTFNGGTSWNRMNKNELQECKTNAYRVLLTRARQGMIIVVPEGDIDDATRAPGFYDPTYEYLKSMGLGEI